MLRISVLMLATLLSMAHAEVYKWTDENGVVHYGDRPVNKTHAQQIEVQQQAVETQPTGSRADKRQKLLEAMEEDRLKKSEQRKKQQEKSKRDRKYCHRLKDHLRNMQRASRTYNLDKDGNRVYQSEKSRSNSIARIKKQMKKYCR